MANNTSLAHQVAFARRQLEEWPEWMKNAARFEGSDVKPTSPSRQVAQAICESKSAESGEGR